MKAAVLLLFLFGLSPVLFSQSYTVANLRPGQVAYIGIDNPISCTVEGVKCKDIVLTTANGVIEKIACNIYSFRPAYQSDGSIVINKKVNNKLVKVGDFHLRVRNIPDPVAMVGVKAEGTIRAGELAAQGGIGAYSYPPLAIDINYTLKSFAVSIMRKEQHLFYACLQGNLFTDELKEKFKNLQRGDVVVFSSMKIIKSDSSVVSIKPIEFTIE